jgi:hypothetical protein
MSANIEFSALMASVLVSKPDERWLRYFGGADGELGVDTVSAAGLRRQGTKCPQCRQENAKTNNNNHIRCWACGSYYCYLCRKVLGGGAKDRSGGKHFSSKGCRQHSAD